MRRRAEGRRRNRALAKIEAAYLAGRLARNASVDDEGGVRALKPREHACRLALLLDNVDAID